MTRPANPFRSIHGHSLLSRSRQTSGGCPTAMCRGTNGHQGCTVRLTRPRAMRIGGITARAANTSTASSRSLDSGLEVLHATVAQPSSKPLRHPLPPYSRCSTAHQSGWRSAARRRGSGSSLKNFWHCAATVTIPASLIPQ
jgi:hypothetical protein